MKAGERIGSLSVVAFKEISVKKLDAGTNSDATFLWPSQVPEDLENFNMDSSFSAIRCMVNVFQT